MVNEPNVYSNHLKKHLWDDVWSLKKTTTYSNDLKEIILQLQNKCVFRSSWRKIASIAVKWMKKFDAITFNQLISHLIFIYFNFLQLFLRYGAGVPAILEPDSNYML